MEKIDVANLKALVNSEGWKVLEKELSDEVNEIEELIFTVNDEWKFNEIKYNENDLLKRLRKVYKTLLSTPEEIIKSWETDENLNKETIDL